MKNLLLITFAACLLSLFAKPAVTHAGMYANGGLSLNDHGFEVDGDAPGYMLAAGFRPAQGGLGGEIAYVNTGSVAVSGLGNLEMTGSNVSAVYWFRNEDARAAAMSAYVKLGLYNITATVAPATANSTGYSAGMGFEFKANRSLAYYTNLDGLALVNATNGRLDMLTVWSVGIRYYF